MKIIVTGQPRTGTSLSMMILDRGGIKADYQPNLNAHINPYGAFETSKSPHNLADGQCMKCMTPLQLFDVPEGEYKIIMPVRDSEQTIFSRTLAFNSKQAPRNLDAQKLMIDKQYNFLRFIIKHRPDMELLEIPYDDYFLKTDETMDKIADFVGMSFDKKEAKKAIDKNYYKIRTLKEVVDNIKPNENNRPNK